MWFVSDGQPVFTVAGFRHRTAEGSGFAMVECDLNEVVAPIQPKAMSTILVE